MSVITKPIGRVIDDVVDAVKDVGDFVQDDILIPVVEGFEDTYKAIEDDPVRSIAYIAASFGPVWLLPLVVAADTMESGGDVDDALEASAKAYAMQYVGGEVGAATATAVGSSTTAATIGTTVGVTAQTVGQVAAGAAVGATSAVILGEDPVQAALMGGAQAGVSAAMAEVRKNVALNNEGGSLVGDDPAAIGDSGAPAPKLDPIPKAVLNVVESQLRYTLSGGDGVVSPAVMQQAIMRATITTSTMQEFLNNAGYEPTDAQLAALTNGVIQTTLAATQGGNVSGTIMKSIIDYSAKSLVKSFGSEAKTTIDKVTGSYEETEKKAGEYDLVAAEQEAAKTEYNNEVTKGNEAKQKYDALRAEVEPRFAERDRLKAEMDQAKIDYEASPSQPSSDAYNNKIRAYNAYATQLDADYAENYKDNLEQYRNETNTAYEKAQEYVPQLNTITERANELYAEYKTLEENLVQDSDGLDEALKPTYKATNQAFVKGMTNDTFNAEEYARLNGLEDAGETGEEIDPFYHWLTTGKEEKLPVNMEQYNGQVEQQKKDLLLKSVEASGVDILTLGKDGLKQFQDQINANYGNDLDGLKNAAPETLAPSIAEYYLSETLKPNPEDSIDEAYAKEKFSEKLSPTPESITFDELKEIVGDPELKYISKTSKDAILNTFNVSDMDIISDNAAIDIDKGGNITWSQIDTTGGLQAYWDSVSGSFVEPKWDAKAKKYFTVESGTDKIVEASIKETLDAPFIFSDLKDKNADLYVNTISTLSKEAGAVVDQNEGKPIYEAAKMVTGSILGPKFSEKEKNEIAGVIVSAGAETIDWINNLGRFVDPIFQSAIGGVNSDIVKQAMDDNNISFNVNPNEYVAETVTDMMLMARDLKGPEMNAAVTKFQQDVANINIDKNEFLPGPYKENTPNPNFGKPLDISETDKALNVAQSIYNGWNYHVGLEYIGTEMAQAFMTGGTGKLVQLATKTTVENAFKTASKEMAKNAGNAAGLTTVAALEGGEAYVANAMGAYDTAYAEAIKAGQDPFTAHNNAMDIGSKSGAVGFTGYLIAGKYLGGNDLENMFVKGTNKQLSGTAKDAIGVFTATTKSAGKEAFSELFEEGAVNAYSSYRITSDINPEFDTTSSVSQAAFLGFLSGGGSGGATTFGVQTGDFASNVIANANKNVQDIFANYNNTSEGLNTATEQFETLGITDNNIKTNFLKVMSPSDYTTQNDIIDATKDVSGTYTFNNNEINQLQLDYVGKTSETNFKSGFDAYVDKGTVDREEIIDAAATENVTLTEDQIKQYIGQKNEIEAITNAKIEFDPLGTTTTEATDFFKAIGYNPSESEVTQFTAPVSEVEQQEAIAKFADPRMTDRDEVTEYFSAIGYNPSEDDITQFIGQIEETKQKIAIGEFTDPKMVDETEAFEAFKTAGLEGARPDDIQSLIGQYDENLLAGKVEEALPGARYNVLDYNLGEQTKKVDALSELLGTKDTKIDALSNLLTDQTTKTDALSSLLGTPATDTDTATGLYGTLANQQTDFNTQLNQQTQDFNALMERQAADAKATADANAAAVAAKEEASKKAAATRATQQQQLQNTQQLYQALQSTPVTTGEVELANIGGPYDFGSIFRDAGQESFYQTPYRKGGQVTNTNDRLLRLIGDD